MRPKSELLHFYKVSGAGNHFVLLDVRRKKPRFRPGLLVRALCTPGHSVGADGVLFVGKSSVADFRLVYYNSDGREAAMCGNGARCAARFAFDTKLAGATMLIEAGSGLVRARVDGDSVELDMGRPRDLRTGVVLRTSSGTLRGDFVNTGVPHFVIVPRSWEKLDVQKLGREVRFHRMFRPDGTNVNFARRLSRGSVRVRTYERGVEAETLACGTGAVAVAVCLTTRGLVRPPVKLRTQGGEVLEVTFDRTSIPLGKALLRGPAQVVYEGDIPAAYLRGLMRRPPRA